LLLYCNQTNMDTLVKKAKLFATQAHRRIDQRRKYTKQPYDVHLKAVAEAVQLAAFGFETKGAAHRVIKELESLRNNLSHAQDIVARDWPQIVRLARRFDVIANNPGKKDF
jgi:hypothetical protein